MYSGRRPSPQPASSTRRVAADVLRLRVSTKSSNSGLIASKVAAQPSATVSAPYESALASYIAATVAGSVGSASGQSAACTFVYPAMPCLEDLPQSTNRNW